MWVIVGAWALLLLAVPAVGALDLVRRERSFWMGRLLLFACGVHPLVLTLWLLGMITQPDPRSQWTSLVSAVPVLVLQLSVYALAACGLVTALALSRGLRPEGQTRWRRGSMGFGLLVVCGIAGALLYDGADFLLVGLPLMWACTATLLGFAREGGPRLGRGGADAGALLVVAWGALVGSVALFESSVHFVALSSPRWPELGGLCGLAVVCTALATRSLPAPGTLLAATPAALAVLAFVLRALTLEHPLIPPAEAPALVDLRGEAPGSDLVGEYLLPPLCVRSLDGRAEGDCARPPPIRELMPAWRLPPTMPLAEVTQESWVVYRARGGPTWKLGHHALVLADPAVHAPHEIVLDEVDGQAVLVRGSALQGVEGPFWTQHEPLPLGEELHRALRQARTPTGSPVRVTLPRSSRWTVQDGVSICASATRRASVECSLAPP